MSPNPDRNKQCRKVIFSEKINEDAHATLQWRSDVYRSNFIWIIIHSRKSYIIDSTGQKRSGASS